MLFVMMQCQVFVMKEGHHKVFTLFGGTKLLTCNSQVRRASSLTDSEYMPHFCTILFVYAVRIVLCLEVHSYVQVTNFSMAGMLRVLVSRFHSPVR